MATNCYLVYEHGSNPKGVLIDPGFFTSEITDFINDNNIDVLCIINTHGHYDHVVANGKFGYPFMVHELDEPSVDTGTLKKTLKDGDVIEAGTLKFEVIHTPGHTPGGITLKCGDMLFTGDTLFFEGVGRSDLAGGDRARLEESIKRLMEFPDGTKVYPGHGPETTIGHEKKFNPYI